MELNGGAEGINNTVADADDPGAINSPSARSLAGSCADMNPFVGGFDLSTSREEPPLLVRRMTLLKVTPAPETVPRLIFVIHPAGSEQFGIVIQPPSVVDLSSTAIGNVLALPVKAEYAEPPSE